MTTTLERLKPHPAAAIFPLLEGPAYADFKADIKAHGLLSPIELLDGQIIDGRNRYRACVELGIEPEVVDVHLNEGEDEVSYVVSLNLHRRHLDPSQLSMVGARIRTLEEAEAKQRQREGGGDKRSARAKESVPGSLREAKADKHAGEASARAGARVNVSGRSVDHGVKVLRQGAQALQDAVDRGEVPVSVAAKVAELPKEKQVAALRGGKVAIKKAANTAPKREKLPHAVALALFKRMQAMLEELEGEIGSAAAAVKSTGWRDAENKGMSLHIQRIQRVLAKWQEALSKES